MAKPIEFKAGSLHAMNANLRELDNVRLADALQVMLGGMGEFFAGEPTVIDVSQVGQLPARVDWAGLQNFEKEDHTENVQTLACQSGVCEII